MQSAMTRSDLLRTLRSYDAAFRDGGATALYLFGSRARGTERPDSDLDLFIDYDAEARIPNLFGLMKIEQELSETLGIAVHITTRQALHPLMREKIERDALRVM